MKTLFSKSLVPALAALVLANVALSPVTVAARGGGGGGGGARVGAGGGARPPAQVNNSRADVRTNNVRSTSVNNVNIDVDQGRWDHPVAAAVVIGAAVGAVGSTVYAVPSGCVPVNYAGLFYQECGGTWYLLQGSEYVLVNPPY